MTSNPDLRWRQRFQSFGLAFARLSAAADLAAQRKLTDLEQQGLIQAFEFTHELAWKTLKDFLESRGVTAPLYGSKDATREAFAQALISDGDEWMAMIAARNATSHTYNQRTADEIATAILTSFVTRLGDFQNKFRQLEADAT
jgi:nucleotidyltransferase substrate binding protein (TIGR01987 family)